MNQADKVILKLAGEEQRLNLNQSFKDDVLELCRQYRLMEERLPIITEEDGCDNTGELYEKLIDLNKCPRCGGAADNGHDRCFPPSPYLCTKCSIKPITEWDGAAYE